MLDTSSLISRATDAYSQGIFQSQAATAAQGGTKMPDEKAARDAAKNFEAFFVSQMLEHMTAGIKTDGMFGGGQSEQIWRSMMNQEYGKLIAEQGGFGVSDQVMSAMLQIQEAQNMTATPPSTAATAAQDASTLAATVVQRPAVSDDL